MKRYKITIVSHPLQDADRSFFREEIVHATIFKVVGDIAIFKNNLDVIYTCSLNHCIIKEL